MSAIRLMVRAATIDLINSLSLWGNLDVLVYSPSKKINPLSKLKCDPDHLSYFPEIRSFLEVPGSLYPWLSMVCAGACYFIVESMELVTG